MNSAIVLDNVTRSFGKHRVLKGVSGRVESGKVVGILGRNGEGKTTLFRILLDIMAADSGDISVLGNSPDGSGRIRLHVGYVPERPAFHDFWTIEQALQFRARVFPSWNQRKQAAIADELDLDLKTKIKGASKGTLAKAAWICATAHEPKVLLLDEPTSGLDALVRDSVLTGMVGELAKEGTTIMVSNHRMEELIAILDEVWVLHDGMIQNVYNIEELRKNAVRVTGKLRSDLTPHEKLSVTEEMRSGNLVRWLVTDGQTLQTIREKALLDQMECEPLPPETTFKLLLAGNRKSGEPS